MSAGGPRGGPRDWTPLIAAVAPNGARRTKAEHPALPMTAQEIAAAAAAACAAGAAMIHLHVRDNAGAHTLDADAYRAAMAAIRRELADRLIIQITTEAVGRYRPEEQMTVVRAVRPEAVSVAIAELVPGDAAEPEAARFFGWLRRERIMTQYILYSAEELRRLCDLWRRGVIPDERPFVLFVLGRYAVGQTSRPADLLPFLVHAAGDLIWAVCAFGRRENACMLTAATLGGHCRVGFENNLELADGRRAPDNAALVAQLVAGAALIGRPLADADTARALLTGAGGSQPVAAAAP